MIGVPTRAGFSRGLLGIPRKPVLRIQQERLSSSTTNDSDLGVDAYIYASTIQKVHNGTVLIYLEYAFLMHSGKSVITVSFLEDVPKIKCYLLSSKV